MDQLVDKTEMNNLHRAFKVLDKDSDGKLSMTEIKDAYQTYISLDNIGMDEIEQIIKKVDVDGNSFIDFSEWVVATINKQKLLTQDNLEFSFSLFD